MSQRIEAPGWDGTNPLYMLAALGLLRLADHAFPGAKLGWRRDGGAFRPYVALVEANADDALNALAGQLHDLGRLGATDPRAAEREVRAAKSALGSKVDELKKAGGTAKAEASLAGLKGKELRQFVDERVSLIRAEVDALQASLTRASESQGESLGHGIAHVGDIIGVPPGVFRRAADRALDDYLAAESPADARLIVAQTAALACDQVVTDGSVVFSPFSFANGASEQKLLRATRQCMERVTLERFRGSLLGTAESKVEGKGLKLGWDPADNRLYALMWADPSDTPEPADVVAGALAYLGMGLLTAFPWHSGLAAVGWGQSPRGWVWPLWEVPLSLPVVRSLLGDSDLRRGLAGRECLARRGIVEVRVCEVQNPTGKRNFFAPSRPV